MQQFAKFCNCCHSSQRSRYPLFSFIDIMVGGDQIAYSDARKTWIGGAQAAYMAGPWRSSQSASQALAAQQSS